MKDFYFRNPATEVNFPPLDLRAAPPAVPSLPTVNWTGSNPYFASSSSVPTSIPTGHSFGQPSAFSVTSGRNSIGIHPPHDYSGATDAQIDKHFVTAYDSSDGRLDIDGFYQAGNRAIGRTIEHLSYQTHAKQQFVLSHKHTVNFSFNSLNDTQVRAFSDFMFGQDFNLRELNFSHNSITIRGVEPLFYQLRTTPDITWHNIQYVNLSDNQIGDPGAEYIAESFKSGRYPHLKALNVSGNPITETGEGVLVEAMKSKFVQDIVVLTRQLDSTSKMIFGTKQEKIAAYKELLQQGVQKGTNDGAIVVDTGFLRQVVNAQNEVETNFKTFFGFIRYKWNPEELVQSYAEGQLIAKLPKTLGKLVSDTVNIKSTVSCYLEAHNDAWTSTSACQ